jgi:hypothetical protein
MTGSQHFRRAEQLAEEAYRHLGQEGEEFVASAWSALAQVHATLALAASTGPAPGHRGQLASDLGSRRYTRPPD